MLRYVDSRSVYDAVREPPDISLRSEPTVQLFSDAFP